MTSIKTVVVHGATGLQGGSVARHLASLSYTVRAIVRVPEAPSAKELAAIPGITLAHVSNLLDATTLRAAYAGSDAVFACTTVTPDEEGHGKAMGDAARATGVRIVVWSGLDSIEKSSGGKYKGVTGFEDKARVSDYFFATGVPAVHLLAGGFFENFVRFPDVLKRSPSGEVDIHYPMYSLDTKMSLIYVKKDLPRMVHIMLEHPDDFLGREIAAAPTTSTLKDIASSIEANTGIKTTAHDHPIPPNMVPEWRRLFEWVRDETIVKMKGLPLIDPKLQEYGFIPVPIDEFVKEEVVPFLEHGGETLNHPVL